MARGNVARIMLLVGFCMVLAGCNRGTVVDGSADLDDGAPEVQQAIDAKPEWFSCKVDLDCIPARGLCRSWSAVNKNASDAFARYVVQMNPVVECADVSKDSNVPEPTVICLNQRCSVQSDS